jgi:hypothetical protein
MECTHRATKSNFVQEAKNDDITDITYKVIFLMNDLFNSNYMGINTISFNYGGNGDLSTKLTLAFYGKVYFCILNTNNLSLNTIFKDQKNIEIDRSLLKQGLNTLSIIFRMDYNYIGSKNVEGTGAFKYLNSHDEQNYVYTQCEPDFT